MPWSRIVSSLCLAAAIVGAAPPQTLPEKPWDPALIARLPESYRAIAQRLADATEDNQHRLMEVNDERLFGSLLGELSQKPEGVQFLTRALRQDGSPEHREQIVGLLGPTARDDPKVKALIEELAASDPDVRVSLAALDALLRNLQRDLVPLLNRRLELAKSHNDVDGVGDLKMRLVDYEVGFTALPAFAYRAPETFEVVPATAESLRVVAFGDFGTGLSEQMDSAAAMRRYHEAKPFAFGLTMGDNFYPRGLDDPRSGRWETDWEKPYGPMGIKFYATYGNHDYGSSDSPAAELAYRELSRSWVFPAPFYSFTAGPAQFFAIDTVRLSPGQLHWLDGALAASTASWKIVYGHYQVYSATRGDDEDMTTRLLPILKRRGVDLYVCGHDHNMQELKPEQGVHFFVIGSGGAGLYDMKEDYPRSIYQGREHGFGVLDIQPHSLTVSLVGLNGKTLHQRRITKTIH